MYFHDVNYKIFKKSRNAKSEFLEQYVRALLTSADVRDIVKEFTYRRHSLYLIKMLYLYFCMYVPYLYCGVLQKCCDYVKNKQSMVVPPKQSSWFRNKCTFSSMQIIWIGKFSVLVYRNLLWVKLYSPRLIHLTF